MIIGWKCRIKSWHSFRCKFLIYDFINLTVDYTFGFRDDLENPIWFTSREGYTGGADNHSFVLGKYAFINTTLVYDLETAINNPVTLSPLTYTALVEVPESTKDRIVKECFVSLFLILVNSII